ncbi:putative Dolichol-phosphate mannosyltransferase [Candidatus Sulfotelmatomonas gaucii]|uniref:Putative Dolichol-phosphate mannosyltransferase n=1 Tax=Candidatus Sulfuritelmatomonas gaucii TaxID=2043161 RepID=A0A2N9MA08_9BACT|nr:putative Dolichol-phosphate mannosyltransferase [Candidatus Sulfotelmatomonas gaucii]
MTDKIATPELEILLPVHNEADSIEVTIREWYSELPQDIRFCFIICEDGSRDGTKAILRGLSAEIPMRLNMSDERKGYSQAVREGMMMLEAEWLLCIDADGQCDPKDFERFWKARNAADVVLGWRVDRQDTLARKSMSRLFYLIYQAVFSVPVHDPSCPYVLFSKRVAYNLASELREMKQGFWWEFVARVHRRGYSIEEIPVRHRRRAAGRTQVYLVKKMPGIFFRHLVAISKIWLQTRNRTTE